VEVPVLVSFALVVALTTFDLPQPPTPQTPPPAQQVPPGQRPATPGQAPAATQTPAVPGATPAVPVQGDYELVSEIGAFLIVVKADKVAAFEGAMTKLKQAFAATTTPATRKQQASGWRVLKSLEKPTGAVAATPTVPASAGTVTYLFLIDPVVKKMSYDPIEIMRELLPNEMQAAYDQLKDSWVSATRIGLQDLLRMGGGL
jgi:hypothetical protein